jgi:hypothetical protein
MSFVYIAKEDEENKKLRGALASTIISEKPNIKWSDVAGIEKYIIILLLYSIIALFYKIILLYYSIIILYLILYYYTI